MQIDPKAAQVVMETPGGADLALDPGKQVVARVVESAQDGTARISLAGQVLAVQTNVPLQAGDEIKLSVTQASATTVQLAIVQTSRPDAQVSVAATTPVATTQPPPAVTPTTTAPTAAAPSVAAVLVPTQSQNTQQQGQQGQSAAGQGQQQPALPTAAVPQNTVQNVVSELAKLGVPVDPSVTNAVAQVVDHLGGGTEATRAVAQLASRDLVLSSAAATRVAAALEVAGKIGPQLDHLAARSPAIAAALPTSAPSAAALRNVLTPQLEPAELAIARIVQAGDVATKAVGGAGGGAAAPQIAVAATQATGSNNAIAASGEQPLAPTSEAANNALRSYASAKLAAASSAAGAPLHLESAVIRPTGAANSQQLAADTHASSQSNPTTAPPVGAPATQAQEASRAAIIGTSASTQSAVADLNAELESPQPGATGTPGATQSGDGSPLRTGANAELAPRTLPTDEPALPLAAQRTAVTAASAAAATGTATAIASPTSAPVADAVADLATLAARIAPSAAPAQGAAGEAAARQGQGTNAAQTAQNAGVQGAAGTAQASNAGASAGGDPRPIVSAVTEFLASGGSDAQRTDLMRTLATTDKAAIAAAVRQLPESDALKLAGSLLESIPTTADTPKLLGGADVLRQGVHQALDDLGRALIHTPEHHDAADELASLRTALQQVASTDPRPAVAHDAAHLLNAMDGQQVLSRPQTGADAGFLYFQVPLPDGRGAEVVVRRDPARRAVTFDEFNIAFLLDTERLGTLMIQLDAHPSGIRADVKTDIPALQPFLEAQTDALVAPLARESRRPVTVSVGSFESSPPTSLLEPQLGLVAPGTTEFYA